MSQRRHLLKVKLCGQRQAGFVQQWSSRWNFAHNVQTRSRPLEVSNAMSGLAAKVDILLMYTLALSLASSIVYARLGLSLIHI